MERVITRLLFVLMMMCLLGGELYSQSEVDHSYKPLTVHLDDSGHKYLRFITWHQVWAQTNNLEVDNAKLQITPQLRRSRLIAYAQVSPRFLIFTHIGLNSLTAPNLTSLGNNGDSPQIFLHGAWTEFKASKGDQLFIGGGLHYWKGLTRLANQSTLNFLTLDQTRPFIHWHSLGVSDQFARHMGAYAKGQIGKFDYRVAVNMPHRNPLNQGFNYGPDTTLAYRGHMTLDRDGNPTGQTIVEGYFRFNFFDTESLKLPFQVGSYLGKKKVFGVGVGFFAHPNGMYNQVTGEHDDLFHAAADVFLDLPTSSGCVTAYASFINFNYGQNFVSRWAGTGTALHGQIGYYVDKFKVMPYVSYQTVNYEALADNISALNAGVNYFVLGHHAKLTLEYHRVMNDFRENGFDPITGDISQIRLQAHIFL
jgi:hypothetical protein